MIKIMMTIALHSLLMISTYNAQLVIPADSVQITEPDAVIFRHGQLVPADSVWITLPDTVLNKNGKFLIYRNISVDSYILNWGKDSIVNTSKDTMNTLPSGQLNLDWYSERAICLTQGCGTACFYSYILPLSKDAKEKFYDYPLAYDTLNNLIAYSVDSLVFGDDSDAYSDRPEPFIIIENFLTNKRITIEEDYLPCPFSGVVIESIFFNSKGLHVRWRNSKDKIVSRTFNVADLLWNKGKNPATKL